MLFLDAAASVEAAPFVAELMAALLQHDESWVRQQTNDYKILAKNYLPNIN
jgi:glycerol-3-phosphate dehydrogenase